MVTDNDVVASSQLENPTNMPSVEPVVTFPHHHRPPSTILPPPPPSPMAVFSSPQEDSPPTSTLISFEEKKKRLQDVFRTSLLRKKRSFRSPQELFLKTIDHEIKASDFGFVVRSWKLSSEDSESYTLYARKDEVPPPPPKFYDPVVWSL